MARHGFTGRSVLGVGIALILTGSSIARGDDEARLKALGEAINQIETDLVSERRTRDATSEALSDVEQKISTTRKALRDTGRKIKDNRGELQQLKADLGNANRALADNQARINKLTRNVLATGRQPFLKLLLNETDPVRLSRSLTWYRYVADARNKMIATLRTEIDAVAQLESKVESRQSNLQKLEEELGSNTKKLSAERSEKQRLLASIDENIDIKNARVQTLRQDESQLRELIAAVVKKNRELKIEQQEQARRLEIQAREREQDEAKAQAQVVDNEPAALPVPEPTSDDRPPVVPPVPGLGFATLKGTLPYPVDGEISARFGEHKRGYARDIKWDGLLISADEGKTIRAIAAGKVIYANNVRIRGRGEIIMIDHGDNFISVYAHTSQLLRSFGDSVAPGEEIAYVGAEGLDAPGVLLNINHNQQPLDPLEWLKR